MRSLLPPILALAAACGSHDDGTRPARAVLIGIDGADWRILDPMIAAGDLPNLASLAARGTRGDLATLSDIPLSPVVWTSIATGKVPAKHGVTWFLVDEPDGTRTPVRSTNRETEALWTIADAAGLATASVGWWATYPAEALAHGVVVSDAMGYHGFGHTGRGADDRDKVSPSELFPRFDALVPPEAQVEGSFAQRFIDITDDEWVRERHDPARTSRRDPFNPIQLFQQYAVTARGYTNIATALLAEARVDLALVYYEQTDSFSHLFMKYEPPKLDGVDERGFGRYGRTVREWYRYQDELLGELLAHVDLDETAVFIVSDHGFKTGSRRIKSVRTVDIRKAHLDHEREGVFLAAGPGIRRGAELVGASVLDVTPTLLHYLDLPVGKDMDGRVLTAAFTDELMERRPIRYVSTHESSAVPSPTSSDVSGLEDGLRALGYLGDDASTSEPNPNDAGPSSPEIHGNRGRGHLARGDVDAALAEFEAALALDPDDADALLGIASVHRLLGRTELAQHHVERALATDPDSVEAIAALAELRRDQGDLREAGRLYAEALALTDASPSLYVGYGDVLQRSGHLEDAAKLFRAALALDPDDRAAHYNLGVTHERLGDVERAVEYYERALELDPEHPQGAYALNNLGAIHRQRGEVDEALAAFEEAAKRFEGHIESRFNAAMILVERGDTDRARELLHQAVAIEPNHEWAQLQLGLVEWRSGRKEDARRALSTVRRLFPGNWRATVAVAALEADAGRVERARQLLDEAASIGGEDARTFAATFDVLSDL